MTKDRYDSRGVSADKKDVHDYKKYINKVPFKYILGINNSLHQDKNYI